MSVCEKAVANMTTAFEKFLGFFFSSCGQYDDGVWKDFRTIWHYPIGRAKTAIGRAKTACQTNVNNENNQVTACVISMNMYLTAQFVILVTRYLSEIYTLNPD